MRCYHIVARRYHHEVGLSQSFHLTSPIGILIPPIEIMRIQGVVFWEWFGGVVIDAGAERPIVERGGELGSLPQGMVERVDWLLHIQGGWRVQVINRGVEEGIVSGGWRVRSVTSCRIKVVVRIEGRHSEVQASSFGHQSIAWKEPRRPPFARLDTVWGTLCLDNPKRRGRLATTRRWGGTGGARRVWRWTATE